MCAACAVCPVCAVCAAELLPYVDFPTELAILRMGKVLQLEPVSSRVCVNSHDG